MWRTMNLSWCYHLLDHKTQNNETFIVKCSVLIVIAKQEEKKEIKWMLDTAYNSLLSEYDVSSMT